jgi:hypothetical protein
MKLRPLLDDGISRAIITGERHTGRWVDVGTRPNVLPNSTGSLPKPMHHQPYSSRRQQVIARLGDGVAVIPTAPSGCATATPTIPIASTATSGTSAAFPNPRRDRAGRRQGSEIDPLLPRKE